MEPTVLIQGVIFSFLGLILVGLSGKIARMPREHKALFLRLSLFGETALTRLFERDRFVRIVRVFWIWPLPGPPVGPALDDEASVAGGDEALEDVCKLARHLLEGTLDGLVREHGEPAH